METDDIVSFVSPSDRLSASTAGVRGLLGASASPSAYKRDLMGHFYQVQRRIASLDNWPRHEDATASAESAERLLPTHFDWMQILIVRSGSSGGSGSGSGVLPPLALTLAAAGFHLPRVAGLQQGTQVLDVVRG